MPMQNQKQKRKVVLLSCGSYDPVTNMHLRMFELARDALNRTGRFLVIKGIISPVRDGGYKLKELASIEHRCEMLKLALQTSEWIRVDTWECDQPQWTTTERVLNHHQEVLDSWYNANTKPATSKPNWKIESNEDNTIPRIKVDEQPPLLKLLCGADLVESFGKPGLWASEDIEKIVEKYGLVCITRAGYDPRRFIFESDVLTKNEDNIFIVTEWISNEVCSTNIRRSLRRGESVRYLIPDPVIDYINKHQLYGIPDNKYVNHLMPSPNGDHEAITPETDEDMSSSSGEISVIHQSSMGSRSSRNSDVSSLSPFLSPKRDISPKHVPCMTDIGTLMRRMKNYNRGFQFNKDYE